MKRAKRILNVPLPKDSNVPTGSLPECVLTTKYAYIASVIVSARAQLFKANDVVS